MVYRVCEPHCQDSLLSQSASIGRFWVANMVITFRTGSVSISSISMSSVLDKDKQLSCILQFSRRWDLPYYSLKLVRLWWSRSFSGISMKNYSVRPSRSRVWKGYSRVSLNMIFCNTICCNSFIETIFM